MKILQVRFLNLNSLVGEWMVDFTHPDYTSNGIFAITGPTGAGKTTILDAICLALFGETPRLGSITPGNNHIMSRQTGECFAEVTFATDKGQFRCQWSQHRARKKPTGDLQPQRHELSHINGDVIDSTVRGVPDQVAAVTGMDFKRFTRSMLLAQGGFAVFLQASANERAPILEQITGTEIYSDISKHVHERTSEENKRLAAMQAEINGLTVLPPKERQQLAEQQEQKQHEADALSGQLKDGQKALDWLNNVTSLQEKLAAQELARTTLLTEIDAFGPDRQRLLRANQAQELAGDYAVLDSARSQCKNAEAALALCQQDVPAATAAQQAAQTDLKAAQDTLQAKKATQQSTLPIIRKVQALDNTIAGKDTELQADDATHRKAESELARQKQKHQSDQKTLAELARQLKDTHARLEATAVDASLIGELAGISSRMKAIQEQARNAANKQSQARLAEKQCQALATDLEQKNRDLAAARDARQKTAAELTAKQTEHASNLDGRDASAWLALNTEATNDRNQAKTALDALAQRQAAETSCRERRHQQEQLNAECNRLREQQSRIAADITRQETEIDLREKLVQQQQNILRLEDERRRLRDGRPCPLCGATSHPYATGNIPVQDDAQQQLQQAREHLKRLAADSHALDLRLSDVQNNLARLQAEEKSGLQAVTEATRKISDCCAQLGLTGQTTRPAQELARILQNLQQSKDLQLREAARVFRTDARLNSELRKLQEVLAQAQQAVARHERDSQNVEIRLENTRAALDALKTEAAAEDDRCRRALMLLQQDLAAYGVTGLNLETLEATRQELEQRRRQREETTSLKREQEKRHDALVVQTRLQAEQIAKQTQELQEKRLELDRRQQERNALATQRQELFDDRNTEAEEQRLAYEVASAEKDEKNADNALTTARLHLQDLTTRINELRQTSATGRDKAATAAAEFTARLAAAGFEQEQDYLTARLPETERRQLANRAGELNDRKTILENQTRDLKRQLAEEQAKNITAETPENLQALINVKQAACQSIQQDIGAIRQKLQENDERQHRLQEKLQAVAKQKSEYERWGQLDGLIGSADGKKYRNFAQGLTFDIMIRHANVQLQKLTDRYLLLRNETNPLELDVVDNYQAGEVRSTKNLSGGESFIVSLALALGLAHMASRNIRVDSLFLDEGFGTLDDDALDTALEALSSLQHDGKLIGIISHVAAIKDRIGAQILVTPTTGGKSRITGPGCQKTAPAR